MRIVRPISCLPLCVLVLACELPVEPAADGARLDRAALASDLAAGPPSGVSVSGGVWRDLDPTDDRFLRHFTIAANDHGGFASGRYNLVTGTSDIVVRGDVTCISVVGNRAFVGGTIEKSELPFPPEIVDRLTGIAVEIVDHGDGSGVDELSTLGLFLDDPAGPQDFCDAASPGPVDPVDRGNFTVR